MKVTINPEGNVELDVHNGEAENAIEFIQKLQQQKKQEQVIQKIEHDKRVEHSAELNQSLYEAWDFLIDHDCPQGVPVSGMARALDATPGAISHRMTILVRRGYAIRTMRGYYRARTP